MHLLRKTSHLETFISISEDTTVLKTVLIIIYICGSIVSPIHYGVLTWNYDIKIYISCCINAVIHVLQSTVSCWTVCSLNWNMPHQHTHQHTNTHQLIICKNITTCKLFVKHIMQELTHNLANCESYPPYTRTNTRLKRALVYDVAQS